MVQFLEQQLSRHLFKKGPDLTYNRVYPHGSGLKVKAIHLLQHHNKGEEADRGGKLVCVCCTPTNCGQIQQAAMLRKC